MVTDGLQEEIIAAYKRNGFGKVLKTEIDALVFHYVLIDELTVLDQKLAGNGEPDYVNIDKRCIFQLSRALKIPETTVCRLLENDFLLHNKDGHSISGILLKIITKTNISPENIKNKKLQFYVANPILQRLIQVEVYNIGGIVDYSFSKDIISVDLVDCLKLLNLQDAEIDQIFRENLSKPYPALPDVTDWLTALSDETNVKGDIKTVLKGIAGKLLDKCVGGDAAPAALRLVETIFKAAKTTLAKRNR
jgi:hypothetical protein